MSTFWGDLTGVSAKRTTLRRRCGIGRDLLRTALHTALTNHKPHLASLNVNPENAAAMKLYRSAGFRKTRKLESYYSPGQHAVELTLQMQEPLPSALTKFLQTAPDPTPSQHQSDALATSN